jgi:uncharacterized protein
MRPLLLDVNVVLTAFRDDHPRHPVARPWFDAAVRAPNGFAVPAVVWTSFLRLATHPRVFDPPTPMSDAYEFIESTRGQPEFLAAEPGHRHLDVVRRLCEEGEATGDLVPDAVIAAIAVEHGLVVASFDRDFARLRSVPHVIPGLG